MCEKGIGRMKQAESYYRLGQSLDAQSMANSTMVFFLNTFDGKIKVPLGYFHMKGLSADRQQAFISILSTAIRIQMENMIRVCAVSGDLTPAMRSLMAKLGVGDFPNVLLASPIEGWPDYAMLWDGPHMAKSSRNHLLQSFGDGSCMTWKDDYDKIHRISWAKLQDIYEQFVYRNLASEIGLSPGVFFLDNMSKMRESPALAIYSSRFIAAVEQHFEKEKGCGFFVLLLVLIVSYEVFFSSSFQRYHFLFTALCPCDLVFEV